MTTYGDPTIDDYVTAYGTSLDGDASPVAADTTFVDRLGNCYEYAGRHVLHEDGVLVHGSIEGFGQARLAHAWVEVLDPDGEVEAILEPTSNNLWPPRAFEAFFSPRVAARYPHDEARALMARHGHYGPWE